MKKKIFKTIAKISGILAICSLFASFSPSLDGRAVVAEDGEFPEGLFAKTVGYLPGDTLCVTNISGNQTVDILVIGALDPSEGVAIKLTPEAAKAVGIERGSNNIVKITKRTGQEDRVYGTAVIAQSGSESEYSDKDSETESEVIDIEGQESETEEQGSVAEKSVYAEAEEVVNESALELDDNIESEETISLVEDEKVETEAPVETETKSEEYNEDLFAETPENEAVEGEEIVETEEPVEAEEIIVAEEILEPEETVEAVEPVESGEIVEAEDYIESDEFEKIENEEEVVEPSGAEENNAEAFEVDELDDIEEKEEENSAIEETAEEESFENDFEEMIESEIPEPEAVVEESEGEEYLSEDEAEEFNEGNEEPFTETVETDAPVEAEAFEEDELEALEEDTSLPVEEENEVSAPVEEEAVIEEEPEEDSETYEAIVLVPAEDNPPVVEETEEVIETAEEIKDEVEDVEEIESETIKVSDPVSVSVESTPENRASGKSYEKYIVENQKDLKKGMYYIQIAVYKDDANIIEIVNKYGKNYPITIVPLSSGKGKQILIGPLNVDEYGTVLARFKAFGFKDAFLRKIK